MHIQNNLKQNIIFNFDFLGGTHLYSSGIKISIQTN